MAKQRIGVNPVEIDSKLNNYNRYYLLLQDELFCYEEIYKSIKETKDVKVKLRKTLLSKRIFALKSEMKTKKVWIERLIEFSKNNNLKK